jgi:hypothetical protein
VPLDFLSPLGDLKEYLKSRPYWAKIEPAFTLASIYLAVQAAAFAYIRTRYNLQPSLSAYLHSYVFKQITLGFAAFVAVVLALTYRSRVPVKGMPGKVVQVLRLRWRGALPRIILVCLILLASGLAFHRLAPRRLSRIRIIFLDAPDAEFNPHAFAYLVYEMNDAQRQWYYEVDFDVVNPNALTREQAADLAADRGKLRLAKRLAGGEPLIAITSEPLGRDTFWLHEGNVSVISVADWKPHRPPGPYDYLVYSLVVQSILIHLNDQCGGDDAAAGGGRVFEPGKRSKGSAFDFAPDRAALKPAILAGHLRREEEELLFNCFGAEYLAVCSRLIKVQWIHDQRVAGNLAQFEPVAKPDAPITSRPAPAP